LYPIPANDDAIKSLQLIADYIQQALLAGAQIATKNQPVADKGEEVKAEG
jgi:ribosomal protein S2